MTARALFASLIVTLISTVRAYSGEATAYASAGGRGLGACGITRNLGSHFETYFAAMNKAQYSGSVCGKCIRVRGARGTILAMVVDLCPGCSFGDVDLSSNGLQATTGLAWDRKPVEWEWASCSGVSTQSTRSTSRRRSTGRRRSTSRRRYRGRRGSRRYRYRNGRRYRGLLAEQEAEN